MLPLALQMPGEYSGHNTIATELNRTIDEIYLLKRAEIFSL